MGDDTACVLIQSPNFFGTIEDVEAIAEIAHKRGALLIVSIAEAASLGHCRAAAHRRHRGHGSAVVRSAARIRRSLLRRARHEREIRPPNAGPPRRSDRRQERQARIRADAGHARAAHPARESDFEYLHQPGAGRADGEHLHDRVRQGRPAGTGEAESGEDRVRCRPVQQTCQSAVRGRAAIQRVRGRDQRRSLRHQLAAAGTQNCRRTAAEEVLSRTWPRGAVVLHGIDDAVHDRYRGRPGRRERTLGAKYERSRSRRWRDEST